MLHFVKPESVDCYLCPECFKQLTVKSKPVEFEISGDVEQGIGMPFDHNNPDNFYCHDIEDDDRDPSQIVSGVYEPTFWCDRCDRQMIQIDPDIFGLVKAMNKQGIITAFSCSGHPESGKVVDRSDDIILAHAKNIMKLDEAEESMLISAYVCFNRTSRGCDIMYKAAKMASDAYNEEHHVRARRFDYRIFPATSRYGCSQGKQPLSEFCVWYDCKDMDLKQRMDTYYDMLTFINTLTSTLNSTVFGQVSRIIGHSADGNPIHESDLEDE